NVNGLLFNVGCEQDLCEKMLKLSPLNKRETLAQEARKVSEDYAPEKIWALWDALLENKTNS
ncbi:MAG: hypothetical protein Q8K36_05120, partial [Alphaproteobacteria bacterium]|nr:hypothetical protein [Alphaproteobacteria bacterium]